LTSLNDGWAAIWRRLLKTSARYPWCRHDHLSASDSWFWPLQLRSISCLRQ